MLEKLQNILGASGIMLLAVNVLPLIFVFLLDWDVFFIIALYWMENVIIGVLNIVRFITILVLNKAWDAIPMIPFFTIHYGMFTFVHGIFVVAMFGQELMQKNGEDFLSIITAVFNQPGMVVAALGLFASHLASYFMHFLNNGEYRHTTTKMLMSAPYKRVVILHLTIIGGGVLALSTGESVFALMLMIVLKTGIDLFAHSREHSVRQQNLQTAAA